MAEGRPAAGQHASRLRLSVGCRSAPAWKVAVAVASSALAFRRGGAIGLLVVGVAGFLFAFDEDERVAVVLGLASLVVTAAFSAIGLKGPADHMASASFGFLLIGVVLGMLRKRRPGPTAGYGEGAGADAEESKVEQAEKRRRPS